MSVADRVMIVGPGRVGLALGYALARADAVRSLVVCGRRPEPPAHPLFTEGVAEYVFGLTPPLPGTSAVFLAVPDDAVVEMAHAFAAQGPAPEGCAAFHLSGVLSTDVLAPLHVQGYAVGSFHPLQAIAHPVTGADRIPGSWFAVTGGPEAASVARVLAAALGCRTLDVPESRRPLYHAAAVMASNFLPPLLDVACRLLERAGVPYDEALAALVPLVRGTLANIEEGGVEAAVTGPIPRGDLETISLHLRALEPSERHLYTLLARRLARLAPGGVTESAVLALAERYGTDVE
ncbi:MAG TPA: Rossmann-like and DUF2520 domain-containing protein [Longimicrobiales bacterium]|nr:Rossmann-like and DUF2520 domain-containing protein [Longimicrobiales bacterium]